MYRLLALGQKRRSVYDRKRVQKTRILFQGGDVHRSAVLCGPAHFHGILREAGSWPSFLMYLVQAPRGWEHLTWFCEAFSNRPTPPFDLLQRRFWDGPCQTTVTHVRMKS